MSTKLLKQLSKKYNISNTSTSAELKVLLPEINHFFPELKGQKDEIKLDALRILISRDQSALDQLRDNLYTIPPPSITEFLENNDYLGGFVFHPLWKKTLIDYFDPSNPQYELILTGCIGSGKSTIGAIAQLYNLLRVCRFKNPQLSMGQQHTATLQLMFMSLTIPKALEFRGNFDALLRKSKYFFEVKKPEEMNNIRVKYNEKIIPYYFKDRKIIFPNNIHVVVGSRMYHSTGANFFGVALDEADFRIGGDPKATFELFTELTGRVTSRFAGQKFRLINLISSSRSDTGMIANYIKAVLPITSKVVSPALWEVKHSAEHLEKIPKFYVVRGTISYPSQLMNKEDTANYIKKTYIVPAGCKVIEVPDLVEYRSQFTQSVEKALKDLAGEVTVVDEKPFSNLTEISTSSLPQEVTLTSSINDPSSKQLIDTLLTEISPYITKDITGIKFKRYPKALRYMHCDLAITGFAGFGVVHKELDVDGSIIIVADLIINLSTIDHINFTQVTQFLLDLKRKLRINFHTISADTYQSVSTMQEMKQNNLAPNIHNISVDRNTTPYSMLSNCIIEGRFKAGHNKILSAQLENIYFNKGKPLTHDGGRKDVADGITGATYNALMNQTDVPTNPYYSAIVTPLKFTGLGKPPEGYKEVDF